MEVHSDTVICDHCAEPLQPSTEPHRCLVRSPCNCCPDMFHVPPSVHPPAGVRHQDDNFPFDALMQELHEWDLELERPSQTCLQATPGPELRGHKTWQTQRQRQAQQQQLRQEGRVLVACWCSSTLVKCGVGVLQASHVPSRVHRRAMHTTNRNRSLCVRCHQRIVDATLPELHGCNNCTECYEDMLSKHLQHVRQLNNKQVVQSSRKQAIDALGGLSHLSKQRCLQCPPCRWHSGHVCVNVESIIQQHITQMQLPREDTEWHFSQPDGAMPMQARTWARSGLLAQLAPHECAVDGEQQPGMCEKELIEGLLETWDGPPSQVTKGHLKSIIHLMLTSERSLRCDLKWEDTDSRLLWVAGHTNVPRTAPAESSAPPATTVNEAPQFFGAAQSNTQTASHPNATQEGTPQVASPTAQQRTAGSATQPTQLSLHITVQRDAAANT